MYKKKNKAFSLVEIIIAMAIIAILSTIALPQIRTQIANARNTKAITTLNTFRIATQMYQIDSDKELIASTNSYSLETTKEALGKLAPYMDKNAKKIIDSGGLINIGGSRTKTDNGLGTISYGGQVRITFINPENKNSDGYSIWLEPVSPTKDYNLKGNKWIEY